MRKMLFPLLALLGCTLTPTQKVAYELEIYEFPLKKYSKLVEGGFSGLYFEGEDQKGNYIFWTLTDRGPNAEIYQDSQGRTVRPFVQPEFNPHLKKFSFDPSKKSIKYLEELALRDQNGSTLSGLPNKMGEGHEVAVTVSGKDLKRDLLGIDPEGLCFTKDHIWIAEEYGPSILKFDRTGKLIRRFVPKGYFSTEELNWLKQEFGPAHVRESLSHHLMKRRKNRGFEGIACHVDKVYAVLQSPLPNDEKRIKVLEFDIKSERVTRELSYELDSLNADKIGDIFFAEGNLFFIEQNSLTGENGYHKIYKVPLSNSDVDLKKELVADLVSLGFNFADKVEGLAILPSGDIFVLNDNDFGLTGKINQKTKEVKVDSNRKSVLGQLKKRSL